MITKVVLEKVSLRGSDGTIQEMTKAEALIQRIITGGINGNIPAAREALKLLDQLEPVFERDMTDDEIIAYEVANITREELTLIEGIRDDLTRYRKLTCAEITSSPSVDDDD